MKPELGKIRNFVMLAVFFMAVSAVKAQTNIAFYPLEEQFNSYSFNPAFLNPSGRFTFSIFPFGGMSVAYNNQAAVNQMATKFLQGNTDRKSVV